MTSPSSSQAPQPPAAGSHIGPFHIGPEIGKGSFAVVHRGQIEAPTPDTDSSRTNCAKSLPSSSLSCSKQQREVAIKIVTRRKLTQKLLDNLEGEIAILKAVSHPNIVELLECLKTDSHIYLVMDFSAGGDLSQYIRKKGVMSAQDTMSRSFLQEAQKWPHPNEGGLNERVVRSFIEQLASAMEFMRARNIVHRDIKPQNLLLQPPGRSCLDMGHPPGIPQLKVADFGFARSLPAASLAETLCGSPLYMAPEILRYEKYDAKADLWSVGAVSFEMVVGKPPFRASNHVELLRRIERNDDRIRFPDERSENTWLREVEKRREAGEVVSLEEEKRGPTPVPDDVKFLIRALLKRHPVERMSFDDFFASPVIINARPAGAASLHKEVGERLNLAPAVAASTDLSASSQRPTPGPALPLQPPSSTRVQAPPPLPVMPPLPKFTPKYIVGKPSTTERSSIRHETDPPSRSASHQSLSQAQGSQTAELQAIKSKHSKVRSTSDSPSPALTSALEHGGEEDEDSQYVMVDRKASDSFTASAEVQNNPRTSMSGAQVAVSAAARIARRPSRLSTRLSSGLNAAVGAVAGVSSTAMASSPTSPTPPSPLSRETQEDGAQSRGPKAPQFPRPSVTSTPLGTQLGSSPGSHVLQPSSPSAPFALPAGMRRQSFLTRRTSGYAAQVGSSSPRQDSPGLPTVPSAAVENSDVEKDYADSDTVSMSTPMGGPVPVVASPGSALARAISNASQKLFGLPAGMSLPGAAALVRGRPSEDAATVSVGAGQLNCRGVSDGARNKTTSLEATVQGTGDAGLIMRLDDLGQKAYVLCEFADSKISAIGLEAASGSFVDHQLRMRQRSPSMSSSAASTTQSTAAVQSEALAVERIVAQEALLIYIKSLGFLQKGIELVRTFVNTQAGNGGDDDTASQGSGKEHSASLRSGSNEGDRGVSFQLSEAVNFLKKRFNETFEKAEFARSKAQESGSNVVNVNRLIYDKAMEIARAAALDELENNHTTISVTSGSRQPKPSGNVSGTSPSSLSSDGRGSAIGAATPESNQAWDIHACLLAYETAEIMLASLLDATRLDAGAEIATGHVATAAAPSPEDTTALTIQPFIKSIGHRCQILRSRVLAAASSPPSVAAAVDAAVPHAPPGSSSFASSLPTSS